MAAELIISSRADIYYVTVSGRATFEQAPQLRSLALSLDNADFSGICVDLGACSGMDSTFMGILAMLGLRARKLNVPMEIFNADEMNKNLLFGLGLRKLFVFKDGLMNPEGGSSGWVSGNAAADSAHTVLEAHKTLMDADAQNVQRFEKVVELVQKDIDKQNRAE